MSDADDDDRDFLEASGIDPGSLEAQRAGDELAPLALRAFARSIDLLVVAIIALSVTVPLADRAGNDVNIPRSAQVLALIGWLTYEAGTVAALGQTVGKMAVHIRVVDHRTGHNPGVARALTRAAVVPALVPLISFFGLLAYATVTIDPTTHRGLLDRLAGTAVVR